MKTAFMNSAYAIAMYIGINVEMAGILFIVMVLDIITGIAKSVRLNGKSSISSERGKIGIISKFLLLLVPILVGLGLKGAGILDGHALINGTIGVLTLSEVYSAIGNIYTFKSGIEVPEIDALSWILGRFRKVVEVFMK